MSGKRDYYEVLGVPRDAAADDVRRAYRQAALKNHPDRNPGDAQAEARFKEATEAYSVLSDDEKRQMYDRFGHAGLDGRGGFEAGAQGFGDIFSQFQDVFSDFFGGLGGQRQQRREPERGRDVRADARITLEDAFSGCKKEVTLRGAAPCDACSGSGAEKGTKPERCTGCNGSGQQTTQRGFIMFSSTCGRCRGTGEHIAHPCRECRGAGFVEKTRTVLVTFPAGIDTGQRLRVPGQGMPGPPNRPSGDLYVDVEIEPEENFERRGADLVTRRRVAFADATLGAEARIDLPGGEAVEISVPAGTQPGTVISKRGRGMPQIGSRNRGDLHVVIEIDVPRKLSRRAKKLLKELDDELRAADPDRVEAS